jgi:tRNA(Arg) A34 adenosine deaminase TadA
MSDSPKLLSSPKNFHWILPPRVSSDYFTFQEQGAGALLLIGMHLTDSMPWLCARHPLEYSSAPGFIDLESKRILGKRFRPHPAESPAAVQVIDPIARVLDTLENEGHAFDKKPVHPELPKVPGKLQPRRLNAVAQLVVAGESLTFYSRNFSELSQCLHAELTLMFGLSRYLSEHPQPPDRLQSFELETTLKPCKMCAAFLHALSRRCEVFHVKYDEDDPGRLAAETLLDRFGYEGSPESPHQPRPNQGRSFHKGSRPDKSFHSRPDTL